MGLKPVEDPPEDFECIYWPLLFAIEQPVYIRVGVIGVVNCAPPIIPMPNQKFVLRNDGGCTWLGGDDLFAVTLTVTSGQIRFFIKSRGEGLKLFFDSETSSTVSAFNETLCGVNGAVGSGGQVFFKWEQPW